MFASSCHVCGDKGKHYKCTAAQHRPVGSGLCLYFKSAFEQAENFMAVHAALSNAA